MEHPPPTSKRQCPSGTLHSLEGKVSRLMSHIATLCQSDSGFGTFTPAVYDSAWVAMIAKDFDGQQQLVFPECFDYILSTQAEDGSWPTYASDVDGVLNTAAALLALLAQSARLKRQGAANAHLLQAISRAVAALQRLLRDWRVSGCVHVGYEILVPRLLEYLGEHGYEFDFPDRETLLRHHDEKMQLFKPEYLYGKQALTALHSLEGLIGLVDFDKIGHHLVPAAGMMGSPASTAAFLMNSSEWNDDAERYLRNIVSKSASGGVPSAYPTHVFEVAWAVTVLAANDYDISSESEIHVEVIKSLLLHSLELNQGITGFAAGFAPDADDTAKSICALHHLGVETSVQPMIQAFEVKTHFKTYALEKNPSFSANCNALAALLVQSDVSSIEGSILKATTFLVNRWNEGFVRDKWSLAVEYSYMSLCLPLVALLQKWDTGALRSLDEDLILVQLPTVLTQLLTRLIQSQESAGSWQGSVEVTAYSVITIAKLLLLPWSSEIRQGLEDAVSRARLFLLDNETSWETPKYLWVEKVTYGSPLLSEVYCLAALRAPVQHEQQWKSELGTLFDVPGTRSAKMIGLFSQLPLFRNSSTLPLHVALVEASLFSRRLRATRLDVFTSRDATMTKDDWLDFIPLTWTSINILTQSPLPSNVMWDMMFLSMLNYQADEYIESVVSNLSEDGLAVIDTIIRGECGLASPAAVFPSERSLTPTTGQPRPVAHSALLSQRDLPAPYSSRESPRPTVSSIGEIEEVLGKFISRILQHPRILGHTVSARARVARELYNYLKAQISHGRSSSMFQAERKHQSQKASASRTNGSTIPDSTPPNKGTLEMFQTCPNSYSEWVHGIGADDTSCPYSFAFFCCLISSPGSYCLEGVQQLYLGDAFVRSLATMCRQYNDYGSLLRDQAEGNLNSLNFPEFHLQETVPSTRGEAEVDLVTKAKSDLMELAEFEREQMQLSLKRLQALTAPETAEALQCFVNITDLFGQIYVVKDIASRVKGKA